MKNKIAIIGNCSITLALFRRELLEELQSSGHHVELIFPFESSLTRKQDLELFNKLNINCTNIDLDRKSLNPFGQLKTLRSIYFALKKIQPDIVLNYTIKPVIFGSIAAKLAGVKKIYSNITGLGYLFISQQLKAKIIRKLVSIQYKFAFSFNRKIFFQNPDDRNLFLQLNLLNFKQTVLLAGSGINTEIFKSKNVAKKKNSFIFVGRLLKDKGIIEYIQAAKKVKSKYPQAQFHILGQIDDNPASLNKSEIDQLEKEGSVHYLGISNDVGKILDKMEVFVLPSYREGTPRSTLEALAMSLPVITTDTPGCRETVVNEENGFLVKVKSADEIAISCEKFIEHPELKKSFGQKSRELAETKFNVIKINQKIINVLMSD
ncbi:glycosyltransferase family 4 protein [Bacteriovoracaceae bacterium]|nr:glycosyltransferase family 4 protein [Bacteriovoracaceae bacterium]